MIVAAVLNGWGASMRRKETRTAALVREALDGQDHIVLARRAMIGWARARMMRRFIRAHSSKENGLLCVGKSLGARNMVGRVLNRLEPLSYRRIALLTIDPCWPLRGDWRPNLNRHVLDLDFPVDRAVNVYSRGGPDDQAGAMLRGNNVTNIPLTDVDHYSIVQDDVTAEELGELVDYLTLR